MSLGCPNISVLSFQLAKLFLYFIQFKSGFWIYLKLSFLRFLFKWSQFQTFFSCCYFGQRFFWFKWFTFKTKSSHWILVNVYRVSLHYRSLCSQHLFIFLWQSIDLRLLNLYFQIKLSYFNFLLLKIRKKFFFFMF